MRVQGEYTLPLHQQAAWDLLLNTEALGRALPGCESLLPIGPEEYEMRLKVAVSSMEGLFSGKIRIEDRNPPVSYRLLIDGKGKLGHVRGGGAFTLQGGTGETLVCYSGEVQIGGLIAAVGERLLDMTTKMMIKKFFNALIKEAQNTPPT